MVVLVREIDFEMSIKAQIEGLEVNFHNVS